MHLKMLFLNWYDTFFKKNKQSNYTVETGVISILDKLLIYIYTIYLF